MSTKRKATKAEFLDGLMEVAAESSEQIADDGTPISNGELLRRLIWKTALGHTEIVKDDKGKEREVKHPAAAWAMQFLYQTIVGKPAPMIAEERQGIKASAQVSQLAKDRLNKLAAAAMASTADKPAGPPKYTPPAKKEGKPNE